MTDGMKHTRNFLGYIFTPGDIIELRAMTKSGRVLSARFKDFDRAALVAVKATNAPGVTAVYYCLNPVHLAEGTTLTVTEQMSVGRSARDSDIRQRANYLIDFDPVRPSGVAATDEERRYAYATALRVQEYLHGEGWPEPIILDSGNGFHLIYRGDRCNPASEQWHTLLSYLDATFGNERVSVDTSVYNPARVSRLPGTWNRKGEDTPDRPHRQCKVLKYPTKWEALDHGKIHRLAARHGYLTPEERTQRTGGSHDLPPLVEDVEEALEEFFEDYSDYLDVAGTVERDGNTYYHLRECPFAGRAHSGALGKTSIILSSETVGFSCFSADCADYTFSDLRRHLEEVSGYTSDVEFYERMTDEELEEEIIDLAEAVWGATAEEMLPVDHRRDRALTAEEFLRMVEE
jgi:hypothetical protein